MRICVSSVGQGENSVVDFRLEDAHIMSFIKLIQKNTSHWRTRVSVLPMEQGLRQHSR
jgi:hypothetical protein